MKNRENNKPQRVLDFDSGVAMVITDLHGDWDAYERYRDRFLTLQQQGVADYFMVLGDMIHRTGRKNRDASVEIVLDLIALQKADKEHVICLLGNHEVPHIYSILLQKGDNLFTPRFEHAMNDHRSQINQFLDSLPFYIRTKAGVTLSHAGATPDISKKDGLRRLWHFSHQQVLEEAAASIDPDELSSLKRTMRKLYGRSYNEMARKYLAVEGLNDPRYNDFLIGSIASNGSPEFDLLWSAMFTKNEQEYGDHGYSLILNSMLQTMSINYHPQKVLLSGHIDCQGGYTMINNQQLRMASAKHAQPREAGLYLLFDMEKAVKTAVELTPNLHSVFHSPKTTSSQ